MNSIKYLSKAIKHIFIFKNYCPEEYWSSRAKDSGLTAVMWRNENYNLLADEIDKEKINKYLKDLRDKKVLDLCCGIGRLSKYLAQKGAIVYGVDLAPMIEKAKERNNHPNIRYIASSMFDVGLKASHFDYVLSVGCIANVCDTDEELQDIIEKISISLKRDGIFLSMDPFHKHLAFLSRPCRHSVKEIIYTCKENGFYLVKKDGIFFIPIRIYLTMIHIPKSYRLNKFLFEFGEFILKIPFVRDAFSDYKILLFEKVI
jgi:SAM-dependent methyltransferase